MDKQTEEFRAFQFRCTLPVYEELLERSKKHRRSLNAEILICLEEYFAVNKILKDANMRDILASLANMPRNFGEYNLTKADLKKFFNTYVDVMMNLGPP